MEKLTAQALDQLIKSEVQGPLVTIYAPMHVTASPPHITENQIRFKNLLHAAIHELEPFGEATDSFRKRLKEFMEQTLDDVEFFENQTPGLLLCASRNDIILFHLPVDTEEYVAVDDQYHLAPVMGLVNDAVDYYVLSVAQHNPTLFKGDMFGLHEMDIELPESAAAALNIDEANMKSEQSISAGGSSLSTAGFNGRGGARNPAEEERMRFFRQIDNLIMQKVDRSLPLVLAGIDAETVEYRSHSKYPQILKKTISGSYGHAKPSELFDQAQRIVRMEIIEPRRKQAIEHFERLRGVHPERTAAEEGALTNAADQGRVDTLLLRMTKTTHDTIRDTLDSVTRITFPEKPLSSTLNKLAMKVRSMSGTVLSLDAAQMPGNVPAAATLRF